MIPEWQRALPSAQIIPLFLPCLCTCRLTFDVGLSVLKNYSIVDLNVAISSNLSLSIYWLPRY